ncbi:hypothetical protein I204_05162 [Kwoniella mangroviensis CBS 8886]|nr:hypothetical protein I204_05162 [Kwoniella mangroviensis CBS 8886]
MSSEVRTTVASADNYSRPDITSSSADEGLGPKKDSARVQRGRDRYDTSNVNSSHGGAQNTSAASADSGTIQNSARVTKGGSGYEMTDPAPPPSDGGIQNRNNGRAPNSVDHGITFAAGSRSHSRVMYDPKPDTDSNRKDLY